MKSFYFILINRTKLIWTHIFSKIEFFKLNIGTSCTQIHMFHRRTVVNFKWKVLCLLFLARFSYFFICLSCHISHGSTIDRWQKYLSVLLRTVLLKKKKKNKVRLTKDVFRLVKLDFLWTSVRTRTKSTHVVRNKFLQLKYLYIQQIYWILLLPVGMELSICTQTKLSNAPIQFAIGNFRKLQ